MNCEILKLENPTCRGKVEEQTMVNNRRQFLFWTGGVGLAGIGALTASADPDDKKSAKDKKGSQQEEQVSAPEDLMREHGVLNRILLIYEEGMRRIRDNHDIAPEVFQGSAQLVRRFIEDYHEHLEECLVFPEFERRGRLADLTRVLRRQHEAGRGLTDVILRDSRPDQFRRPEQREELVQACTSFVRMYRPHEAREDTVLFPELHRIVSKRQIQELGERFEEEEHHSFGQEGFEHNVERVAAIERQLGIYELAQFTPRGR
jgi:hemerythrin-like domain-containing protein